MLLEVTKFWQYESGKLQILLLIDGVYVSSATSEIFANFSLVENIPRYLAVCRSEGRNKGIKAFRSWVKQQLDR